MDETHQMPKGRYAIMRRYMPKVGGYGEEMMFRTCTVQVNLDFSSEADMVKKFRVGLALQPVATGCSAKPTRNFLTMSASDEKSRFTWTVQVRSIISSP